MSQFESTIIIAILLSIRARLGPVTDLVTETVSLALVIFASYRIFKP